MFLTQESKQQRPIPLSLKVPGLVDEAIKADGPRPLGKTPNGRVLVVVFIVFLSVV